LAYLVLVSTVIGLVYLMSNQRVDVDLVIDLSGARSLAGQPLAELTATIADPTGRFIGSTHYSFPRNLFEHGPPLETVPARLQLKSGEYEVRLDTAYGVRRSVPGPARAVLITVEEAGTLRVKAAK
jgi:hypothetical protein